MTDSDKRQSRPRRGASPAKGKPTYASPSSVDGQPQADLVSIDHELAFGCKFGRSHNHNVFCPYHEDAESKSPSCSVSRDGVFNCKVCGARGTSIDFYCKLHGVDRVAALAELASADTARKNPLTGAKRSSRNDGGGDASIPTRTVKACHDLLLRSTYFLEYVTKERGLSMDVIRRYEIGCDENRLTIPIYSGTKCVNVRRYLPHAKGDAPKMLSHVKGDGSPRLYPESILKEVTSDDLLIVCEGEWDCLLLLSLGYKAITNTSNCSTWRSEWTEQIAETGARVAVVFDVNDKERDLGQRMAVERCQQFVDAGILDVRRVELPLDNVGGDVTDFFIKERRTTKEFNRLIAEAPDFRMMQSDSDESVGSDVESNAPVIGNVSVDDDQPFTTLHEASKAEYNYETIRLRAIVAGKLVSPFILPRVVTIECRDKDGAVRIINHTFDRWDGQLLSLIDCSQEVLKRRLRSLFRIPKNMAMSVDVVESMNIEEVFLIPAIDTPSEAGPYTLRKAYYVGHGLRTNHVYEFVGYTLPHPDDQTATHLLVEAKTSDSDLDTFQLTAERAKQLRKTFGHSSPYDIMEDVADQLSHHVTHIYGRADLHNLVDLVIHSPLHFRFGDDTIRKGWLEALVVGDTRTGKGFVTEGLFRHYGLGEVLSGENVSFAGLVGGITKMGDRQSLVWGRLPLNDRRVVALDECSSLSYDDIGRLSRLRSEGIAEVTKIVTEKTTARVRLVWLSNPRTPQGGTPKVINDFAYGIEAVSELIGSAEDIARFDIALVVGQAEVSSTVINKRHHVEGELRYTADLCRDLIYWIWSRKADDVVFESGVVEWTMRAAHTLGQQFSSRICLVQAEDARFKLARLACAVAGRCFSTDSTCTKLVVKKEHVEYAYNFLHHVYSKPVSGYLQMSAVEKERSQLRDEQAVIAVLEEAGDACGDFIEGLLEQANVIARDICDYANVDIFQARSMLSELVRQRALRKGHNSTYVKRPAFKHLLQRLRAQLAEETSLTQKEEDGDDSDN